MLRVHVPDARHDEAVRRTATWGERGGTIAQPVDVRNTAPNGV